MRPAFGAQFVFFRCREQKCCPIIDRRFAHVQLFFTLQVQLDRSFETFIDPAHLNQQRLGRHILRDAQGLPFGMVPLQPQPAQIGLEPLDVFFLRPLGVGIVNAQDEAAAILPGYRIVHQGRPQVADVNPAGRRRGKAGSGHDAFSCWVRAVSYGRQNVHMTGATRAGSPLCYPVNPGWLCHPGLIGSNELENPDRSPT